MSTISNRFFVTAIEDGSTLHGNLRATKSLAQAWKQGQCTPDWAVAENQPVIYLSLMSGGDYVTPDDTGYTWEYNGTAITWLSSADDAISSDGRFQKTTYNVSGKTMPAIRIIQNLASSDNVNVDVITFRGQKTISSAGIPFSATIDIRITEWVNGGYMGTLTFEDGLTDITADNSSVTIIPALYNDAGAVPKTEGGVSRWNVKWYLNDTQIVTADPTASAYQDGINLVVTEAAVTDYATVRCEFYTVEGTEETLVFTAHEGIDDTQDPEYMYVEYATGSGNAASLRTGGSVTFNIWIGTMTDPTPASGWAYKVKILDAKGDVYTDPITGISNADAEGYRTLPVTSDKAAITISYETVTTLGKALTGLIQATTSTTP